jgi:MFS family permease
LKKSVEPLRVVWTLTLCTSLSLLGDTAVYAVLPSHYAAVGITALQLGWILSINRLVRLPLNIVSGWMADKFGPKQPYVAGLIIGALSTVGYGLSTGFWPLLACRVLWGVAWACLAVAAYGMILDVGPQEVRGRLTGIYTPFAYFGGSLGAMLGGFLVDAVGFSEAMLVLGACTFLGCLVALSLPPTQHKPADPARAAPSRSPSLPVRLRWWSEGLRRLDSRIWLIWALSFTHRFFFAGVFYSTFGLHLANAVGEKAHIGKLVIGIASLTGALLFVRSVATVLVGPSLGYLSDRLGDRTYVLLLGEALGVAGLLCLAVGGSPWLVGAGVLLAACAYGVVPPMLVSWMGDLTSLGKRGSIVGGYQTMGDLGSGTGPLVAYALVALVGTRSVYGLCAGLLFLSIPLILAARRSNPRSSKL